MTKISVSIMLLAFLTACSVGTIPGELETEDLSLVRKWYTNSEDDRYYIEFRNNGTLYHRYYQFYGSIGSGLNGFVTEIGNWSYLDDEQLRFAVGWDDSVDRHYDIVASDSEKLAIRKSDSGPVGRGLGDIFVLLRTAAHGPYQVPEEILPLIGTWYYEETRDGESLTFHEDSSCVFHYYQDYGGYLTGWVSRTGSWRYDSEDNIISITMPGEITYPYILEIRTIDTLFLEPPENGPGGTSMIYSGTCLYK